MAESTQKRPSLVLRHSSNSGTLSTSAQHNKPRAHLVGKKNRSSGQLSKMTRTHSSKNLVKTGAKPHIKFKKSASQSKLDKMGIEQKGRGDWEEDEHTAPMSVTQVEPMPELQHSSLGQAAAPTYVGSFMGVPVTEQQLVDNGDDPVKEGISPGTSLISPHAQIPLQHHPKSPKLDQTHARILNRNVSFAAAPTVSQAPGSGAGSSDNSDDQGQATIRTKKRGPSPISSKYRRDKEQRSIETSDGDDDDNEADGINSESATKSARKLDGVSNSDLKDLPLDTHQNKVISVDQARNNVEDVSEATEPRRIELEKPNNQRHLVEQPSDSSPGQEEQDSLSEDESSIEMKQKAVTRNKDFHSSAQEPISMPAHDIPISRTQFRLNLERQHTLNFREPRQRPSHWPSFDGGAGERRSRETDPITGRVSVPRVCREARRELKTIRQRGHDPLCDAVDTVLNSPKWSKRTSKLRETPKPINKKTFWASGQKPNSTAKSQTKPMSKSSPAFEFEARVAAVGNLKHHCQRLWNTPVEYGKSED